MKRIFALFLALTMALSLTALAGEFNAGVEIQTSENGNTTITVQDSDLYEKQDVTLTVPCALTEAYVVYEGKAVTSTLTDGKITFSVIGGGTYTIKQGTPSEDELPEAPTVTITYTDGVNGAEIFEDQSYTVDEGSSTPVFSGTPSREGYTFKGWSPAFAETASTDVTYVAQWEINEYELTWSNGDGGSYEQFVEYGATITVPNNEFFNDTMRKAGHTLTGWTNAENYQVGASMPAQALTFTAQYAANTYTVTYTDGVADTVIFADQTTTAAYGTSIPAFDGTPSRIGYTFSGWDIEIPATVPASDITFNATWSINQYTISFNTDGGSAVSSITQDYNSEVTAPTAPAKPGYTFAGWKTADGVDFTFSGYKMGAESFTLTAKWNPADGTAYAVNHHYQNIENDEYTVEAESKSGVTNAQTAAEAKTVTGFTAGQVTQQLIKADGSTVIDIYYTRNTHTLTFKPDNGEADITSTVKFGAPITAPSAPVKSGYTFSGWGDVAATMPDHDVTYTAKWELNKTSSGSSSTSSKPGSTDVTIGSTENGNSDLQVDVSAKVEIDSKTGSAEVTMDTKKLEESLAQQAADTDASNASAPVTVTIDLSESKTDVNSVTIDSASIAVIADAAADKDNAISGLTVKVDAGNVTLDTDVLSQVAAEGKPLSVSVSAAEPASLTEKQQKLVGDRPVVEITVSAGDKELTDLGDGRIQASLPYTPAKNENLDKLVIWRVLDDGTLVPIPCTYENGMVHFELDHLSHYVIVSFPFADVSSAAWYYQDVAYAWSTGLMNGTGTDMFSPDATTSRGMIVTILWRLEGMPTAGPCTFTDVKSGSYYEQAIAWAAENGIVNGYGKDSFRPDATITREQFATILYRYAKDYKGYDVSVGESTNILSYEDAFDVSEYAIPALQWACGAGVMNGSDGYLLPAGSATRAQAAALLHRFCENVK